MKCLPLFFIIVGICFLHKAQCNERLNKDQDISFIRGQLIWKKYLQEPGMAYDLEEVIKGMLAAEQGAEISINEIELQSKIRDFQKQLLNKQTVENLQDAEEFLAKLAEEQNIHELTTGKLYYQCLKPGIGKEIKPNDVPILRYSIFTYNRWGEEEVISIDDPVSISPKYTIPGFARGIADMKEGEIRKVFVHPDLAYGTNGKLDPNLLIIFTVELVSADSNLPSS